MQRAKQKYVHNTTLGGSEQRAIPMTVDETEEEGPSNSLQPSNNKEGQPQDSFMKPPSKQIVDSTIGEFIEHTSDSALAIGVCAMCARETNRKELMPHCLDCIPSSHQLQPEVIHPRHNIIDGMLLQPAGLTNNRYANVCMECLRSLNLDKIPTFTLANRMWIGQIPHKLAYLTLPEQLLIAKYFPAAYIIKLYPKKKGA